MTIETIDERDLILGDRQAELLHASGPMGHRHCSTVQVDSPRSRIF